MANPNALIVEVVGDTTRLTKGLKDAERQLSRFAGRSKIRGTGADALLGDVRGLQAQAATLAKTQAEVSAQSDILNSRLATTGVKAGIAGLALYAVGRNMSELGGTAGKLGQAFSDLSTGNIVGFVKGLQSINEADPKKMAADLLKYGDAAKATKFANDLAAAGFDTLAAAARGAATQLNAAAAAARAANAEANVAASLLLAGGNDAAAFGERTDRFGRGPGWITASNALEAASGGTFRAATKAAAAARAARGRRGITAAQRNQWFDSRIARELDRVQDIRSIRGQVSALKQIEAEIKKRMAVTKDITRWLNLEDELLRTQRRRKGLHPDAKEGGPLTATTQLSENILAGLSLSRASTRTLLARLSNFNSAGVALAGAGVGVQPITTTVVVDGKVVAKASAKYNRRGGKLNPAQRNGPNAGTQVS